MKYTEKIHAEGLLEIFSQDKPCGYCPSYIMREKKLGKRVRFVGIKEWDGETFDEKIGCGICWNFIGAERQKDGWDECPCYDGNQARAAKLTWLALEAKGYLE